MGGAAEGRARDGRSVEEEPAIRQRGLELHRLRKLRPGCTREAADLRHVERKVDDRHQPPDLEHRSGAKDDERHSKAEHTTMQAALRRVRPRPRLSELRSAKELSKARSMHSHGQSFSAMYTTSSDCVWPEDERTSRIGGSAQCEDDGNAEGEGGRGKPLAFCDRACAELPPDGVGHADRQSKRHHVQQRQEE